MRGVVSAGMLKVLAEYVPPTAFDDVYGSSAGALNGAFFIAGQAEAVPSIYSEQLTRPEFFSLRHLVHGRPMMSLQYLVDVVLETITPLDWERVLTSPVRLHPIAASVDRFEAVDLQGARTREELKARLVAAATMPLIAGPPLKVGDERFWDTSLYESIAARRAAAEGATHLLVLRTRDREGVRNPPGFVERALFSRRLGKLDRRLRDAYNDRARQYDIERQDLARLEAGEDGCSAVSIYPDPASKQLSQFARAPEEVRRAAKVGEDAARALLAPVFAIGAE